MIPRGFVDVTSDLPERRARASFLKVTNPAVCGSRQVIPDPTIMNCSGGSQRPAVRTNIDVARVVVSEVEVGEHAVSSLVSSHTGICGVMSLSRSQANSLPVP